MGRAYASRVTAPAAMPREGQGNPERGIGVSSAWGWGPAPAERRASAAAWAPPGFSSGCEGADALVTG